MYHINCSENTIQICKKFDLNETSVKEICLEESIETFELKYGNTQYYLKTPLAKSSKLKLWELGVKFSGILRHVKNILSFGIIEFASSFCTKGEHKWGYHCGKLAINATLSARTRKHNFHFGFQSKRNPECIYHPDVAIRHLPHVAKLSYKWTTNATSEYMYKKTAFQKQYEQQKSEQSTSKSWVEAEQHCKKENMTLPHLKNKKSTKLFVFHLLKGYHLPTFALFVGLARKVCISYLLQHVSCSKSCMMFLIFDCLVSWWYRKHQDDTAFPALLLICQFA